MEDYRYSMKYDDDDEDEEEVFDQEGSLYIPNSIGDTPVTNTNMSSSLYSFSDDEEEEIWEDPSSDGKLVTSLRNMPFAGDSPLWQGVELRHRLKLNERLKEYKKWFRRKQKAITQSEMQGKDDFIKDNKFTNTRPWIDIYGKKKSHIMLRPVLGGIKQYYKRTKNSRYKKKKRKYKQHPMLETFKEGLPAEKIYSKGFSFGQNEFLMVNVRMNYLKTIKDREDFNIKTNGFLR